MKSRWTLQSVSFSTPSMTVVGFSCNGSQVLTASLQVAMQENVTTGIEIGVTVTALSGIGVQVRTYTGTVAITTSDGGATTPANNTLTNGQGVFLVTFATPGTVTVTATDVTTSSITGNSTIQVF